MRAAYGRHAQPMTPDLMRKIFYMVFLFTGLWAGWTAHATLSAGACSNAGGDWNSVAKFCEFGQ